MYSYPQQIKEFTTSDYHSANNQIFKLAAFLTVDAKSSHQNYDLPVLEIVLTLHVKSFITRSSVDPKASVKQTTFDNLKCFNVISVPLRYL